jgi:hypothetical protein
MSTIFHHPEGHHGSALCNDCGDAEAETLCCIVSSESALGHCAESVLVNGAAGDRSVAERFEIDVGAALVILQIAVRRIVEQDRRVPNEPIVEGPL